MAEKVLLVAKWKHEVTYVTSLGAAEANENLLFVILLPVLCARQTNKTQVVSDRPITRRRYLEGKRLNQRKPSRTNSSQLLHIAGG